MIVVFTDDLICAMRARYGLAAAALPQADSPNCSATASSWPSAQSFCSSSWTQVVDEVGLQDRVVGLEADVGLGAAVLLGDLRQALARRRPVAVAQRDDRGRVLELGDAVVLDVVDVPVDRLEVLLVDVGHRHRTDRRLGVLLVGDRRVLDLLAPLHLVDDLFVRLDHPEGGVFLVPVVELRVAHGPVGGDRLRAAAPSSRARRRRTPRTRSCASSSDTRPGTSRRARRWSRTASCTRPASWCPSGSPATWSCRPARRRGRWWPRSAARPRPAGARPRALPGCPCCAGTSRCPWCTGGRASRAPWRPRPGCGPSRRRGRSGPGRAARRSSTATSTAAPCRRRWRRRTWSGRSRCRRGAGTPRGRAAPSRGPCRSPSRAAGRSIGVGQRVAVPVGLAEADAQVLDRLGPQVGADLLPGGRARVGVLDQVVELAHRLGEAVVAVVRPGELVQRAVVVGRILERQHLAERGDRQPQLVRVVEVELADAGPRLGDELRLLTDRRAVLVELLVAAGGAAARAAPASASAAGVSSGLNRLEQTSASSACLACCSSPISPRQKPEQVVGGVEEAVARELGQQAPVEVDGRRVVDPRAAACRAGSGRRAPSCRPRRRPGTPPPTSRSRARPGGTSRPASSACRSGT